MIVLSRYRNWLIWLGFVFAAWVVLEIIGFRYDAQLLFITGCIISVSVLIMFFSTRDWTLRNLGVFGLIAFDAGIYAVLGGADLFDLGIGPEVLNWLRATIIVSAPLLLLSQMLYLDTNIRARWRKRREARS